MISSLRLIALVVCMLLLAACGSGEPPCTNDETSCEPRT